uniref:Uncharacterized protein n=1 Tax=Aegilops tauschii TaxID=37682 RepID=M8B7G4_AEGTA
MKSHQSKSVSSSPKRSAAFAAPVAFLLVLVLVTLYDLTFADRRYLRIHGAASSSSASPACDLTRGEWVQDAAEAPYYTNLTCPFIDDHQNCMKFGKPSLEFLRWRWRPDGCELPRFDAARFLEAMRGKSMAFVGDSLARNHFKSLLCLLSRVAQPVEVGGESEIDPTGRAVRRDTAATTSPPPSSGRPSCEGFRGKAVLRTVTPAHFEGGEWNTGGDCVRPHPYRRGDRALGAFEAEYRSAQVEALRETKAAATTRRNGAEAELVLMDITEAMDLRPDGHPSRYGHRPGGSVEGSFVVDCLHWCLPGPIDLWSELLAQMLLG